MKFHARAMYLGGELYTSGKTGQTSAKVLVMVPGDTDAISFFSKDMSLLNNAIGMLFDCVFDYNDKFGRLNLVSMVPTETNKTAQPSEDQKTVQPGKDQKTA